MRRGGEEESEKSGVWKHREDLVEEKGPPALAGGQQGQSASGEPHEADPEKRQANGEEENSDRVEGRDLAERRT